MNGHSLSCSGLLPLCVLKPKLLQAHPGQQVQLKGRLGGDGHAAWGHTPSVCRVLHQLQSWDQLSHKQGLFLRNWPTLAEHWGLIWTHTDPSHLGALTWTCFPLPSRQFFLGAVQKQGPGSKPTFTSPRSAADPRSSRAPAGFGPAPAPPGPQHQTPLPRHQPTPCFPAVPRA